jgi:hypothetical protein
MDIGLLAEYIGQSDKPAKAAGSRREGVCTDNLIRRRIDLTWLF